MRTLVFAIGLAVILSPLPAGSPSLMPPLILLLGPNDGETMENVADVTCLQTFPDAFRLVVRSGSGYDFGSHSPSLGLNAFTIDTTMLANGPDQVIVEVYDDNLDLLGADSADVIIANPRIEADITTNGAQMDLDFQITGRTGDTLFYVIFSTGTGPSQFPWFGELPLDVDDHGYAAVGQFPPGYQGGTEINLSTTLPTSSANELYFLLVTYDSTTGTWDHSNVALTPVD